MTRHRRHGTAKKRAVVEACLNGEALQALSRRHDVCRSLIRLWIEKCERGSDGDGAVEAELLSECKAWIAALERLVGRQAPEPSFRRGLECADSRGETDLDP